jgi:anthranilate/para-aminobenzoate synthase component II
VTADHVLLAAGSGTPVSFSSGVIVAIVAILMARRRNVLGLCLLSFAAGVMLSGSQIAGSVASAVDQFVVACGQGIDNIIS